MLIWVGIYDLDVDAVKMIVKSFLEVFPDATMWESIPGGDYLMVGFNGPLQLDYSIFKSRLGDARVRQDLARVGLDEPEKLIARLIMGPGELREFSAGVPLHSDDRRQLELRVPRLAYYSDFRQKVLATMKSLQQYRTSPEPYLQFSHNQDRNDLAAIDRFSRNGRLIIEGSTLLVSGTELERGISLLEQAYQISPEDFTTRDSLYLYYYEKARMALVQGQTQAAMDYFSRAWQYSPKGSLIPAVVGYYYLENQDLQQASLWAARALAQNPYNSLAWMLRGRTELAQGRPELAFKSLARGLEYFPRFENSTKPPQVAQIFANLKSSNIRAEILFYMGESLRAQGKPGPALGYYVQAETVNPDYYQTLMAGGKIFLELGQAESALKRFQKAEKLNPELPEPHLLKAFALEQMPGRKQEAVNELNSALKLAPRDWPERATAEEKLSRLLTGQ